MYSLRSTSDTGENVFRFFFFIHDFFDAVEHDTPNRKHILYLIKKKKMKSSSKEYITPMLFKF